MELERTLWTQTDNQETIARTVVQSFRPSHHSAREGQGGRMYVGGTLGVRGGSARQD